MPFGGPVSRRLMKIRGRNSLFWRENYRRDRSTEEGRENAVGRAVAGDDTTGGPAQHSGLRWFQLPMIANWSPFSDLQEQWSILCRELILFGRKELTLVERIMHFWEIDPALVWTGMEEKRARMKQIYIDGRKVIPSIAPSSPPLSSPTRILTSRSRSHAYNEETPDASLQFGMAKNRSSY